MIEVCSDGRIGIRTGLKILGPQGIEGSTPSPSIKVEKDLPQAAMGLGYPVPCVVLGKILGPQGIEGLEHHAHYVVLRS